MIAYVATLFISFFYAKTEVFWENDVNITVDDDLTACIAKPPAANHFVNIE